MDPLPASRSLVVVAKRKRGRPVKYSAAVGRAVCKMLERGMSVNAISKRPHMPAESTIRKWAANPDNPFSTNYALSRQIGYLRLADELLEIADDGTNDYVERENSDGSTYAALNSEHIQRSRLRVDTRKWILAKMLPKVYGDKTETTHKLDASAAFVDMMKAISDGRTRELTA